ncbi:MAG: ferredoxin, partial [Desulfobacteraceae bacterium 4572_130]
MKHKIIFKPYNKEIQVEDGASLIRTAMEAGVHINASCGGEGVCGKCRILLEKGEIQEGISEYLSDEDIKKGYYLACKSKIKSDLVVRIPIESEIDTKILNLKPSSRYSTKIKEFDLNKLKENESFIPPVEKKYIELNKPSASDN